MVQRFACLVLLGVCIASAARAENRPNFVWLISEDNSIHYLKMFDPHGTETPRIQELAAHGLVFDNAFSNSPVCSVARTTLMTSCYAPRIGTQFHRKAVTVPMPDGLLMFPAYLRAAGYYATNNKKKDYNAIEGDHVWDESSLRASWRNRNANQPFFHMQSFGTTHESQLHFQGMTEQTQHDPKSVFVAPYHPDTPTFRYTNARYRDRIRKVDQQIGEVIDQLRDDGLLENTFIFYFGDHGGVLPRGKGYAYESGLHVPLVIRVPKKWKSLVSKQRLGSRQSKFVSFIDFGPTVLNLAGIKPPNQIDGRSIFASNSSRRDFDAFGHADRFDEKVDLVRTLRKGKYEYVRSYQPFNFDGLQNNYRYKMLAYREWRDLYNAGKLNSLQSEFFEQRPAEALYDIDTDPHETTNLANDKEHADILRAMRASLSRHVKGMPDLSFYPESHLVDVAFDDPVAFGQKHKNDIAQLVDIANLQLLPFDQAESQLSRALESEDRWRRYWGLIVCSSFGKKAIPFAPKANELAASDAENLVRLRAAEFLALIGSSDTRNIILKTLHQSRHGVEANLVLNTLVLLRDGPPKYEFDVPGDLSKSQPGVAEMNRRLLYLSP